MIINIEILEFVFSDDWGYVIVPSGIALYFLFALSKTSEDLTKSKREATKLKKLNAEIEVEKNTLKKENEKLTDENYKISNQNLKHQLQPHSIRNIISVFKDFTEKLEGGMNSFSDNLDYILEEEDFVSVEREVDFIEKYVKTLSMSLTGMPYTIIKSIDTNSHHYSAPCIPHLISGYFIENAFKYGDKKLPHFVDIYIKLNNNQFELIVINKVSGSKSSRKSSEGKGLKNMEERLSRLMKGKHYKNYEQKGEEFHSSLLLTL